MHHYQQPGFASSKKQRKRFTPNDDQIAIAERRIKGALERNDGILRVNSDRDAIAYLEKNVYNRDHQLGDHKKGHFRKVLLAAWQKLKKKAEVVFDPESYLFRVNYRFEKKRRTHRQKYPAGRLARVNG